MSNRAEPAGVRSKRCSIGDEFPADSVLLQSSGGLGWFGYHHRSAMAAVRDWFDRRVRTLSLPSPPVVRQFSGESPVFLSDLLNYDVDVLGFLPQHAHKRGCHVLHQFGLLSSRCTVSDLNIDVWHIGPRCEFNMMRPVIVGSSLPSGRTSSRRVCQDYEGPTHLLWCSS